MQACFSDWAMAGEMYHWVDEVITRAEHRRRLYEWLDSRKPKPTKLQPSRHQIQRLHRRCYQVRRVPAIRNMSRNFNKE